MSYQQPRPRGCSFDPQALPTFVTAIPDPRWYPSEHRQQYLHPDTLRQTRAPLQSSAASPRTAVALLGVWRGPVRRVPVGGQDVRPWPVCAYGVGLRCGSKNEPLGLVPAPATVPEGSAHVRCRAESQRTGRPYRRGPARGPGHNRRGGGDVVLAAPQPHVLRLLALTSRDEVICVQASVEAALAGTGSRRTRYPWRRLAVRAAHPRGQPHRIRVPG
jgi:hypothetical protein